MGTSATSNAGWQERDIHDAITAKMRVEIMKRYENQKCVLLGLSNSGKTTIIKQFHNIMNTKYKQLNIANKIRKNCIKTMIQLCELINDDKSIEILNDLELSIDTKNNLETISKILSNLWNNHSIQVKYSFRANYDDGYLINDNMEHFFNQIDKIMNINYKPTNQDILKHKTNINRITNIVTSDILEWEWADDYTLQFIDYISKEFQYNASYSLGKRIYVFDRIGGAIIVSSLSDFCVYNKKQNENAMQLSFKYLEKVIRNKYFTKSELILLLNKVDIFKDMLRKGMSLKTCFGDKWNGKEYFNVKLPLIVNYMVRNVQKTMNVLIPMDIVNVLKTYVYYNNNEYFNQCYEDAIKFIKQQYNDVMNKYGYGFNRVLFIYELNALDAKELKCILTHIWKIMFGGSLRRGGLMV